jgi:hypothetical protein
MLQKANCRKHPWVNGYFFTGEYEDFDSAATTAVAKFGRGPYLIRQVGEEDLVLPASVVYCVSHDAC